MSDKIMEKKELVELKKLLTKFYDGYGKKEMCRDSIESVLNVLKRLDHHEFCLDCGEDLGILYHDGEFFGYFGYIDANGEEWEYENGYKCENCVAKDTDKRNQEIFN